MVTGAAKETNAISQTKLGRVRLSASLYHSRNTSYSTLALEGSVPAKRHMVGTCLKTDMKKKTVLHIENYANKKILHNCNEKLVMSPRKLQQK